MKLYVTPDVTLDTLRGIADDMGITLYYPEEDDGVMKSGKFKGQRRMRFTLRPDKTGAKVEGTRSKQWQLVRENPFGSRGMGVRGDGRRNVHAICFHGHWHFMRRVFDLDPAARFVTGFDVWAGEADFMERAEASGMRNIGSIMYPLQYREACDCDLNGGYILGSGRPETETLHPVSNQGGVTTYVMSHSMIRACPHVIMVPSHYRADGTCRCDDPTHTEMAEWEYKWNGVQWVGTGYNNEES
jgi:hypothetical protein